MEQRTYRGNISPEALADHLVSQYDPKQDLQAQKIGQGDALMVQIGRGDIPTDMRHAVTVSIARAGEGEVAVTMGQQQWLTPSMATYTAVMGIISLVVTPWALFALLWPMSEMIGSTTLPGDVWNTIDGYMASQGAVLGGAQDLRHPHAG